MNTISGWNDITQQQMQILSQIGMENLPAPAEINPAQWAVLAKVLGEDKANQLRAAVSVSLAYPALPAPAATGNWQELTATSATLQAKLLQLPDRLAAGEGLRASGDTDPKWANIMGQLKNTSMKGNADAPGAIDPNTVILLQIASGIAALACGLLALAFSFVKDSPDLEKAQEILGKVATGLMVGFIMTFAKDENQLAVFIGLIRNSLIPILEAFGIKPKFLDNQFLSALLVGGQSLYALLQALLGENAPPPNFRNDLEGMAKLVRREVAAINPDAVIGNLDSFRLDPDKLESPEGKAWLAKMQKLFSDQQAQIRRLMEQLNSGIADAGAMLGGLVNSKQKIAATMGA